MHLIFNADNATANGLLGTIGGQFGPVRAGVSCKFENPGEVWERLNCVHLQLCLLLD